MFVMENPLYTLAILCLWFVVFSIIRTYLYICSTVHGPTEVYCPVCGRNYRYTGWLARHIEYKHPQFHRLKMAQIRHMFGIENPL